VEGWGNEPSKRSQFDGRKFERSAKIADPWQSALLVRSTFSLSLSLPPLSSVFCLPRIPFGFLRHDFQLQFRIEARSILDAWRLPLSLSLSLSLSAVDFLVHRPNFPGRYGQFNTGLTSTSPCQIGGKPLFQWPSRGKGQNRFLRAPVPADVTVIEGRQLNETSRNILSRSESQASEQVRRWWQRERNTHNSGGFRPELAQKSIPRCEYRCSDVGRKNEKRRRRKTREDTSPCCLGKKRVSSELIHQEIRIPETRLLLSRSSSRDCYLIQYACRRRIKSARAREEQCADSRLDRACTREHFCRVYIISNGRSADTRPTRCERAISFTRAISVTLAGPLANISAKQMQQPPRTLPPHLCSN